MNFRVKKKTTKISLGAPCIFRLAQIYIRQIIAPNNSFLIIKLVFVPKKMPKNSLCNVPMSSICPIFILISI